MATRARQLMAPIILGVAGTATLISLSVWQVQRLAWKEGLIAELSERLRVAPMVLPADPDQAAHEFRRVVVTGRFTGETGRHGYQDAPLLATLEKAPGYRVIQPFETTDGRRLMISRGWVPLEAKNEQGRASRPIPAPSGEISVTGALRWPDDPQTPVFGTEDNVWIARDLATYATVFDVEPLLVVAETPTPGAATRAPVPTPLSVNLPNNHFGYALTWGLLAAAWAAMSALWARTRLRSG
ncbi:MAG: SURF1 family protein [Pseudomonadota bacterium]